jgi:hypothetical protein
VFAVRSTLQLALNQILRYFIKIELNFYFLCTTMLLTLTHRAWKQERFANKIGSTYRIILCNYWQNRVRGYHAPSVSRARECMRVITKLNDARCPCKKIVSFSQNLIQYYVGDGLPKFKQMNTRSFKVIRQYRK